MSMMKSLLPAGTNKLRKVNRFGQSRRRSSCTAIILRMKLIEARASTTMDSGRLYDNLPSDWGDMTPLPTYRDMPRGMDDELTRKYPLFLLTSHSRYRVHYLFWEHSWLRNHVYRHRVWINAADAKARGIKDNDMVIVFNDRGKVRYAGLCYPKDDAGDGFNTFRREGDSR